MIYNALSGKVTFVEIPEGKGPGEWKWIDVCSLGEKLYFCPSNSHDIMIYNASTGEVTFVEIPEGKGQRKDKWAGVCALGEKVYFCPRNTTEIMSLKQPISRRERCETLGLAFNGWQ
eukprot:CAMPEP_0178423454 /NCGR_PEP_ID=MMETSP0689_2-20121128/27697_1 /TAXON_ID=160604 /ORGANISM="Amphidinium massartii, Strain CS-259" /LENGTH=116 /DNA_ID=CAMNT_0020045049 /DNA_START=25 /DNA_END=372 /DNA_ORIENTATION=-